jgi:protein-disulfide isomerase
MQRWFNLPILLVLAASFVAAQQTPAKEKAEPSSKSSAEIALPSEETVNSFLQQMFGYDPTLTYKVADIRPSKAQGLAEVTVVLSSPQGQNATKLYVTPDGKHALAGEIMPFGARPFAADSKLLESAKGPSRGPADAPVTIVVFSDLQCPHCKDAEPKLDKLLADKKNVRFVYQSFPLPMHDWAAKAAAYADCTARSSNDAFWKFVDSVFAAQADITAANVDEKLTGLATAAGAKGDDIAACAAKPDTQSRVQASVDLAQSLNINSTPTIFINGRRIESFNSMPDDTFNILTDFAAKEAAK